MVPRFYTFEGLGQNTQVAFIPRPDLDLGNLKDVNPLEFLKLGNANVASEVGEVESFSEDKKSKGAPKKSAKAPISKTSKISKANTKAASESSNNSDDATNNEDANLNHFFEDNMQG